MNPEKIGRYEIKSELGRGGMATVYQAYDPRFERDVAVKVLPHEMLHDPQFRIRFEREAKTIALLEHPAIVPVYDVGEEDGQPYFVMRFMNGGDLAGRIKQGPLSIAESAHLIEKIAPALDEAHAKGIIHRDLKPANILFDPNGEPYISDFGIAKMAQSSGTTVTGGAIIGTPAYMSPEQGQGEKVDGRSDIYALGVIVYEMLTGRQPYVADTPMAVVVKHITEPVPHILDVNPNLPIGLEKIIETAMAKKREERFASAREFSAALSALARGEAPSFVPAAGGTEKMLPKTVQATPTLAHIKRPAGSLPGWLFPALTLIFAFFLIGAGIFAFSSGIFRPAPSPTLPPAATPVPATATSLPAATNTPAALIPPSVEPPTPTASATVPTGIAIGGADQVAFIANNEIWLMKLDGSDLQVLTNNQEPKTALQWMPDGRTLAFISGTNINTVEADTGRFDTIVSFPFAQFLDAFRISPAGKQVAISLNKEMYIVPLDLETLRQARGKDSLIAMKGCVPYKGGTRSADAARDFRWGAETLISWVAPKLFEGKSVELIQVMDISSCNPDTLRVIDDFPGTRFRPDGYMSNPAIPDFDWDGDKLFLMNTAIRNEGWGDLYTYNMDLRKANKVNPIDGKCCYRDARWSPDKSHIFFAFQDFNLGAQTVTQFYYIPVNALNSNAEFSPIPLPEAFFKNLKEAPQPALHLVSP
ncbi:MAG: hypothetical protein CO094_12865 [Anaerolineae bacterium CG_4_9_14_3_um_filter_57_17]|nr:protein kinase [bacterium]NCT21128.1 protein kinase [bacterium]OIO83364.1 MAG: hypothetical protein AUK01_13085 [Anaerolineae bacterium CG2_30_57_67]PJB64549.1 MAG: hypothetical protein CO094_12865 [Anaerolineae bacterium CG_4_9_14_3_um_filter_57_17]